MDRHLKAAAAGGVVGAGIGIAPYYGAMGDVWNSGARDFAMDAARYTGRAGRVMGEGYARSMSLIPNAGIGPLHQLAGRQAASELMDVARGTAKTASFLARDAFTASERVMAAGGGRAAVRDLLGRAGKFGAVGIGVGLVGATILKSNRAY